MQKIHKTAKGTELPIQDIKGKDYLEVKWRIVWFREEKPNYGINTELIKFGENFAVAKAVITNEVGLVVASGHKTETVDGFQDFIEKAETGAIGRALALIGYGTQFTGDDLNEGNRLADSPTQKTPENPKELPNMAPTRNQPQQAQRTSSMPSPEAGKLSEKQVNRLNTIASKKGWKDFEVREVLDQVYSVTHAAYLSKPEYDEICNFMDQGGTVTEFYKQKGLVRAHKDTPAPEQNSLKDDIPF